MMFRMILQRAVGTALLALPCAVAAQDGARGREVFVDNGCYQCHGYEGQGGAAGPRIAPSPYPAGAFMNLVRRPVSEMPAYSPATLSDATLRAIYEYVRSVPEPPALEDIALLGQ